MPITMNDLTISPDGIDFETLLSDWDWLMPEPVRPVMITATGDVFAQGDSGSVYFLDVIEGQVRAIADDGGSFQQLLRSDRFVTVHMFPARIIQFRNAGLTLQPKQVYSHKQLLVLGGTDDFDNFETTDVGVHISIHGQVHRQIRDVPDGTRISGIKIR